jgi:hypothetical protein
MSENRVQFPPNVRDLYGTHARLRAVLDSLDLDLEAEFARFRQAKVGSGVSSTYSWQPQSVPTTAPTPQIHPVQPDPSQPEPVGSTANPVELENDSSSLSDFSVADESLSLPPFDLAAILQRSQQPDARPELKALPAADNSRSGEALNALTDFLDSSEVLRNGLTEVDLEVLRPQRRETSDRIRSAWGLGAIALLASVGMALLAYAQRPQVLTSVKKVAPPRASAPVSPAQASPASVSTSVPDAANLAQVEFQNLSQTSLSVLKPNHNESSQPSPVRVVVLKADTAILSRVQQLAPNAFLEASAQGAKIQVGVFSEAHRAEALVSALQKEGLAAQIER